MAGKAAIPNLNNFAIHINSASSISLSTLTSQFEWVTSIETAALLCIEQGGNDKETQHILKAGYALLSRSTSTVSHVKVGRLLVLQFLHLYSANKFQRASRILTSCIECAIKPASQFHLSTSLSSSTSLPIAAQVIQAIERISSFLPTISLCLCNFGVRRPALKLIEYVLIYYLNTDLIDCAFGWIHAIIRSHLKLVDMSDARRVDDLMTLFAQVLSRVIRSVKKEENVSQFKNFFWPVVWKIMKTTSTTSTTTSTTSTTSTTPNNSNLSRTLSCLRLCTAVNSQLSLESLLESESDNTISIGCAVIHGLTGKGTSHLARLQALELCCSWITSTRKEKKRKENNRKKHKVESQNVSTSVEEWILSSTPALNNFFNGTTDSDMPGNYIQRLRSTLSTLLLCCASLRPLIANTICTSLNSKISLKHGRLLLSLLLVPHNTLKTHWLLSLPTSTQDDVKKCVLRVMQFHQWSEIRQTSCEILLSLGTYSHLLESEILVDANENADYRKRRRFDSSSLVTLLEYHAKCGNGGKYCADKGGTASLLFLIQKGVIDSEPNKREINLHRAGEAVSTALALPLKSLLPHCSEYIASACRLLVHLAPHLSTVQNSEKENEPDYADPSWITCRSCCMLMQRLISANNMLHSKQSLEEWGCTLLDVIRKIDHHGAMLRSSAVLQNIASALLINRNDDKNEGKEIVMRWTNQLVQRASSMHELSRIRFSHDLPPCLMALMKGIIKAAEDRKKMIKSQTSKKRKYNSQHDEIFMNASNCVYNSCVLPMLTLAANIQATIPSRIAAFHVLIRVFETHQLRGFVLKKYTMKNVVQLAIECCQASVPYALSSAAALFWSVIIDLMITTSAGNCEQCTPCTLFLRYPSVAEVLNDHTERLTLHVLSTNQSHQRISTGLSTSLVILSLCSQLAPPTSIGDPVDLHQQLCGGLIKLCHALLSSPQMLFRLLAAKTLAKLTHPNELVRVVEKILLRIESSSLPSKMLSINTIHGLLLQLTHLKILHGNVLWGTDELNAKNILRKEAAANSRIMNCACTAQLMSSLL